MEIIKTVRKVTTDIEVKSIRYSEEAIKKLVTKDIISKGHEIDGININVDYKYVSDEWGMNRFGKGVFNSVEVIIK